MILIKFLLLLTVFLTPLIGAFNNFGYEQAKVLFFIVSISLSGFLWLLTRPVFKWTGISIAAGLFVITLIVTSITGIDLKISFFGSDPYFQGVILYAYLFLFFLLVRVSKIKLEHWAYVLVGSATVVGLLAIGEWVQINLLGHELPTYAGRVVSTFGQPNFYSGFILLALPFFRYLLASKGSTLRGWWVVAGFLISILAIVLSESKSAFLILGGLIGLWLIFELRNNKLLVINAIFAFLALATFASFYLGSGLFFKTITKPLNATDLDLIHLTNVSVEQRVYIWPMLMERIKEKPISGYGLENISDAYSNYFQKNYHSLFEENLQVSPLLIRLKDLNIDRAHNYILDLLLFSGVLGLLGWLVLVGLLIKKLILSPVRAENTALLLGLFTYLIWIQFQNQSVVHLIYFWLIAFFHKRIPPLG